MNALAEKKSAWPDAGQPLPRDEVRGWAVLLELFERWSEQLSESTDNVPGVIAELNNHADFVREKLESEADHGSAGSTSAATDDES